MRTFSTILHIDPKPKARPRFSRGGIAYTDSKSRAYDTKLKYLLKTQFSGQDEFTGALRLTLRCGIPRPKTSKNKYPIVRPDADNFLKGFCDIANGILWRDDCQVIDMRCMKLYSGEGFWEIIVEEVCE